MEYVFLGIIIFLFILAVFDLSVGVSNDAANFLNSAVGSRAARFRTVVIVAAAGVFIGAVMSNGMMDIARHGVFRPEHFSFFDILCIFMAVMVTDIILLDVFNTLGLPTSTTVSMVFGLLGAAFAVSLFKIAGDDMGLGLADLLNTGKALSMIIGIFLSVAVAFVFGTLVQYISRLWFSFDYRRGLAWKIGLFGGVSMTAIVYFLLLKGAKDLVFMTPEVKAWVGTHTLMIVGVCFVATTLLSQLLHLLRVNVFKVIVLSGTFALAMAFAGNDLVNFIGVPLAGLDSYSQFVGAGATDPRAFMMDSLNAPASTPIWFLLGAGLVMTVALATSKKARKVVNTSVSLSRQDAGDEMFGSSRLARRLVRVVISMAEWINARVPEGVRRWAGRRLDPDQAILEEGAAFDLVRGCVNLVLAGMLIALGTSLKLPLSTTYVTFMVAMGSSLADRAWGRESAVFRITGVISVIGGWFITAGVAFIGCALVASVMHLGGVAAMVIAAVAAISLLIRNNIRTREENAGQENALFRTIIETKDQAKAWELLKVYVRDNELTFLRYARGMQQAVADGFFRDNAKMLSKAVKSLAEEKAILKNNRRKATLCLRQAAPQTAIENSAWFHLSHNSQMAMLYNLRRIAEVCHEHVDNNFRPAPQCVVDNGAPICARVAEVMSEAEGAIATSQGAEIAMLRRKCDKIKDDISAECRRVHDYLREDEPAQMAVLYVYLNMMQEMQEMVSHLRKLLRASLKLAQGTRPVSSGVPAVSDEGLRVALGGAAV